MRGIKTPSEILKIKKTCELGDKVYSQILKKINKSLRSDELKNNISEKELAREIVRLIRLNKGKLSFRPIVAFGKNASEVHHKPTNLKLNKKHGFVMIDMGIKLNGYCSDMTRTVFFGKATKKQKKIYQTVFKAQQKAIDFLKSSIINNKSINGKQLDEAARNYIVERGFSNIPHSVGHGIGKRVHESFRISPKSKTILKNGMVFTIEPGIYIKGLGGVRIEDTFYLNRGKLVQLTKSPKKFIEL